MLDTKWFPVDIFESVMHGHTDIPTSVIPEYLLPITSQTATSSTLDSDNLGHSKPILYSSAQRQNTAKDFHPRLESNSRPPGHVSPALPIAPQFHLSSK